MQYVIGFFIALFIALTGVGAGTVTVPVLVLFLGVPAPVAVGIGLMFATAVKLILVPAQIARKQCCLAHAGLHAAGRSAGCSRGVAFPETSGQRGIDEPAECDPRSDSGHHGDLADPFFVPQHGRQPEYARPQSAALVAYVSRLAQRWVSLPRERVRWAVLHC